MDLTNYKNISGTYYINEDGLVYNLKTKKFIKVRKNGSIQINIDCKSKTLGTKKIIAKLFNKIDLDTYKQYKNSNHYVSKDAKIVNKYNEEVKARNCNGYFMFSTIIDGKHKEVYIHRAVAELYLPNLENYTDVHHIDNDKSNNIVDNLEWTTHSKNCRMYSRKKQSNLPRGVSYNNVLKKYQSGISIDSRNKHLGFFNTIEEAHNKYLEEYKKIMGFECKYK